MYFLTKCTHLISYFKCWSEIYESNSCRNMCDYTKKTLNLYICQDQLSLSIVTWFMMTCDVVVTITLEEPVSSPIHPEGTGCIFLQNHASQSNYVVSHPAWRRWNHIIEILLPKVMFVNEQPYSQVVQDGGRSWKRVSSGRM